MEQFNEVLKIRNLPVDVDFQAKKIIEMAIDKYDTVPFVPIVQKLRFHNKVSSPRFKNFKKTKEINLINFWTNNMKRLSREYYFGKSRKLTERFSFSKLGLPIFLPKYSDPIFKGNLCMIAEDVKSELIAKILINNHENEFHCNLIDILSIRPLTFSEYISLFLRYPETSPFVDAALGFSYEKEFNIIFEKNTGVSIPISIAPYLADVFLNN